MTGPFGMAGVDGGFPEKPEREREEDFEGRVCTGIVKSNWDEDHPGRVQVEYRMGEPGKCITGWVPVMTPYAGPGYGLYLLPEVETEVLVAFLNGDAHSPVVIGCLWNRVNTWPDGTANEGNTVKRFRTKSGFQIELEETDEEERLTVSDSKGENRMELSSKEGTVSIQARERFEVRVGDEWFLAVEKDRILLNEQVTITEDVSMKAGSIEGEAEKGISWKGQDVSLEGSKGWTGKGKQMKLEGDQIELKGKQVKADTTSLELKGKQVKADATALELKGQQIKADATALEMKGTATVKLSSSGMMEVKGTIVQLN